MVADRVARVGCPVPGRPPLALRRTGGAGARAAGRTGGAAGHGWWLDKVPPVPWWADRDLSGGPIVEQAVHVLDLARVLVGEVSEVSRARRGTARPGDVETATAALLGFRDGAVGHADHQLRAAGQTPGRAGDRRGRPRRRGRRGLAGGRATAPARPERTDVRPVDRTGGRRPRASSTHCTAGPVDPDDVTTGLRRGDADPPARLRAGRVRSRPRAPERLR